VNIDHPKTTLPPARRAGRSWKLGATPAPVLWGLNDEHAPYGLAPGAVGEGPLALRAGVPPSRAALEAIAWLRRRSKQRGMPWRACACELRMLLGHRRHGSIAAAPLGAAARGGGGERSAPSPPPGNRFRAAARPSCPPVIPEKKGETREGRFSSLILVAPPPAENRRQAAKNALALSPGFRDLLVPVGGT
jgi:hypothetical protein